MSGSELTQQVPDQVLRTPKSKARSVSVIYRFHVFFRFTLALFGGYFASALLAKFISIAFKASPVNAALSATMLAFVCYACIFIWIFLQRSFFKAALGVVIPSIVFAGGYLAFGGQF